MVEVNLGSDEPGLPSGEEGVGWSGGGAVGLDLGSALVGFAFACFFSGFGISTYWSSGTEGALGLKGTGEFMLSVLRGKQIKVRVQGLRFLHCNNEVKNKL